MKPIDDNLTDEEKLDENTVNEMMFVISIELASKGFEKTMNQLNTD